jgi:hypothetical protein
MELTPKNIILSVALCFAILFMLSFLSTWLIGSPTSPSPITYVEELQVKQSQSQAVTDAKCLDIQSVAIKPPLKNGNNVYPITQVYGTVKNNCGVTMRTWVALWIYDHDDSLIHGLYRAGSQNGQGRELKSGETVPYSMDIDIRRLHDDPNTKIRVTTEQWDEVYPQAFYK